ncbi:ShlB/FhaC/HecB family hemolysin secretion/activation protein [Massilia sp. TN1-12]|uniref:ShlB/FhaC/HecB family hemolysin secretion/activation protein n=1 Tax=Massilia paldalensis TaxID=3377675 RepID=UPI00384A5F2F
MPRPLVSPTRLAWLLAAAFSGTGWSSANAQTAADAAARQADVLQRQNQERINRDIENALPRERASQGIDTRALVPKVDASAAGKKCNQIQVLAIEGAPELSGSVRAALTKKFSNQCLGVAEIEEILGEITKDYVLRGYVTTRAYLPAQDLSKGKLTILVLEGRVESVVLTDKARKSITPWNVFPAPGGLLNLRDFEQGIDQLNKLSSNSAVLDIQPGEQAGASKVVIDNTPTLPYHASLSADNTGSDSTGRNQLGATVSADDLMGLNELLLFTYRRSQPNDNARKGSVSKSLSFIVPFRYATLSYSGSRAHFTSLVAIPNNDPLAFQGTSDSDSVRADYLVFRNQTTRQSLAATLTVKDSKNYLAGNLLSVASRKLSVLDLDSSTSTDLWGGALSLDLGWAQGLSAAGALKDADNLPDSAPRAQFGKFKYGLNYLRPFQIAGVHSTWTMSLTGQRARDVLYGSEQLLIGGLYTVRGFVNNTLSGDNGWYVRNELALNPVLPYANLPMRLYAGLDYGRVSSRAADTPEGSLAGRVVGASFSFKGASVDVSNSRALREPGNFKREGSRTWIRLNFGI